MAEKRRSENFKKQLTQAQRDEIFRLSLDGYSTRQIMDRCRVSYMTALRYSDESSLDARSERLHYGTYPVAPLYEDWMPTRR